MLFFSHFDKSGRELDLKERATVVYSNKRDIVTHGQNVALSSNLLRTLDNQGAGITVTYVYYSAGAIESIHLRVMIFFTWFTKGLPILTPHTHSVRGKAKMTSSFENTPGM